MKDVDFIWNVFFHISVDFFKWHFTKFPACHLSFFSYENMSRVHYFLMKYRRMPFHMKVPFGDNLAGVMGVHGMSIFVSIFWGVDFIWILVDFCMNGFVFSITVLTLSKWYFTTFLLIYPFFIWICVTVFSVSWFSCENLWISYEMFCFWHNCWGYWV